MVDVRAVVRADVKAVAMPDAAANARRARPGAARRSQPTITDLLREGQEIIVQIAKEPIAAEGRAHHFAHRAAGPLPRLHADHRARRRLAQDRVGLRARAPAQAHPGHRQGGGRALGRLHRPHGGRRHQRAGPARRRALPRPHVARHPQAAPRRRRRRSLVHKDLDLVQRILRDQLSEDFTAIRVRLRGGVPGRSSSSSTASSRGSSTASSSTRATSRSSKPTACRPRSTRPSSRASGSSRAATSSSTRPRRSSPSTSTRASSSARRHAARRHDHAHQHGSGRGDRAADPPARPRRHHRPRPHRHGGAAQPQHACCKPCRTRSAHDKSPTKVLSFNDFGLVIMTRKRVKQSLERTLCSPCPYCTGAGLVKSPQTICYEILEEARTPRARTTTGERSSRRRSASTPRSRAPCAPPSATCSRRSRTTSAPSTSPATSTSIRSSSTSRSSKSREP